MKYELYWSVSQDAKPWFGSGQSLEFETIEAARTFIACSDTTCIGKKYYVLRAVNEVIVPESYHQQPGYVKPGY